MAGPPDDPVGNSSSSATTGPTNDPGCSDSDDERTDESIPPPDTGSPPMREDRSTPSSGDGPDPPSGDGPDPPPGNGPDLPPRGGSSECRSRPVTDGGEDPPGGAGDGSPNRATFEEVDWSSVDRRPWWLSIRTAALVLGLVGLTGVFLYDRYVAHVYLVGQWNVQVHEWIFMLAGVIVVAYGLVPLLRNPTRTRTIVDRLRDRPVAAVSTAYLAVFVVVALLVPWQLDMGLAFEHQYHPPLGFTAPGGPIPECVGEVSTGEDGVTTYCSATTEYPFGTNERGHDMLHLVASGMRVALIVAVFTVGVIVPLATTVGVLAGYFGGRLDALLMSYVDVQLSVPAIIVYFIAMIYVNPQLWLLLVAFGLLSWGGIARLVRSEVIQRREAGFVLAAESAGASRLYVARRHLMPNVTNTIVPATCHLIAILILTEAGLSFLGFHDQEVFSWGRSIAEGLTIDGELLVFYGLLEFWWVSTFPAIALGVTVLAFKLAGDGLRDALDPRGSR